jgi:tetratricopeptide (TPR) repeat protein
MKTALPILVMAASAFAFGCNGGAGGPDAKTAGGEGVKTGDGKTVSQAAANKFNAGTQAMAKHDKANDWNAGTCKSVAGLFEAADSNQKGDFFEAQYNVGVAQQRCKNNAEARKIFSGILGKNSKFHRARVQVALYKFQENKDIEAAIGEMEQAIKDAEFKNEEALVNLAMLQMKRDSSSGGSGCENDFDCAKLNLQRALAINDGFMPSFNQLAVFYLESAKKKAGRTRGKGNVATSAGTQKRADSAALELAALVVSQALRKNPRYAPVHNTSGLISAELGDLSTAARSFGTARKLDTGFFEAHMNYAAVNLQFRGFKQAETAYRAALKLNKNDYEANLGLALAVRGQINDSNFDKNLKEAETLLAKAKKLDGSRPETYYNEAILVQEFKARAGGKKAEPILMQAKGLFDQFIAKAGDAPAFAAAVKRSKERAEEIDQVITFNKQTRDEQKRMEADKKRREAEALKNKGKKKK